ncbi:Nn.00g036640.m01.CDS01 [Neocucurbitaria sp. VM-36]
MALRYYNHPDASIPDLIDLSDPEELYLIGEEGPTQRDANDVRLKQAINYIAQEGGDDSPTTFIHRVDRIDEALLQQLPQAGADFDRKLYRRLRAMVIDVQREFEEAAEQNSSFILASDDGLPEYHTPSIAQQALHKEADEAETPLSKHAGSPLRPRRGGHEDNVLRERIFKYGGPNNEVENWYRDYPAILPFPETLQMAHWESLKIDYDLSKSAKTDTKAVETDVSFNHPHLEQYKNLNQYDSGSRFKLPVPTPSDEKRINELWSKQRLKNVVNSFNKGDRDEEVTKDYAPRVFLEKFAVGRQVSPTAIRRSMNITPTKPRRVSNVSIASSPGSARRVMSEPEVTESLISPMKTSMGRPRTPASHPRSIASQSTAASAAFRRISESRREALRSSPGHEIISSSSKQPHSSRLVSQVEVPKKRGRGRPPKSPKVPKHQVPAPAPTPTPVLDDSPPNTSKALGKRKRSIGSETYTPDGKRKKSIGSEEYTPESLKKKTRSAAVAKKKKVDFTDPLVSSPEEGEFLITPVREGKGKGKQLSKAVAAGKQVKKRTPKVIEKTAKESTDVGKVKKTKKTATRGGGRAK